MEIEVTINNHAAKERSRQKHRKMAVVGASVALAASTLAACGGGSGSSSDEIKVGVIQSLTGPSAAFGKAQTDGAKAVADAINASGGIKELGGAKIKLVVKDSQSDPVVAGKLIREMAREKVSALIGPNSSPEVISNKPLLQNIKIPAFVPSGDNKVTEDNVDGSIFRVATKTSGAAGDAVKLIGELQSSGALKDVKKVGILSTSNPPGPDVAAFLEDAFKEQGISTIEIKYDASQVKDFAPTVAKFRSADVDMIAGFQFPNDATLFAQAFGDQSWRPKDGVFMSGTGTSLDAFRKANGPAVKGWVSFINSPTLDSDYFPPEVRRLSKEFEAKHKITMEGSTATIGGASMALVADSLAAAKSADPKKVTDAARRLNFTEPKGSAYPYYMMAGGVKFDKNQDNTLLIRPFAQLSADGGFTTIYPKSVTPDSYKPFE